jgi:hypothetical protein
LLQRLFALAFKQCLVWVLPAIQLPLAFIAMMRWAGAALIALICNAEVIKCANAIDAQRWLREQAQRKGAGGAAARTAAKMLDKGKTLLEQPNLPLCSESTKKWQF